MVNLTEFLHLRSPTYSANHINCMKRAAAVLYPSNTQVQFKNQVVTSYAEWGNTQHRVGFS